MKALVFLALLAACAARPRPPESLVNLPCDVTVPEGEAVGPSLTPDRAVCAAAGDHPGGLFLDAAGRYTLRGPGRINPGGRGAALRVAADDVTLAASNLIFGGGRGELGATVRVDAWSNLEIVDSVIEEGRPAQGGASGLGASAGELALTRVEIRGDVLLTGAVTARLTDCAIHGSIRIREGANVELRGGSVRGPVHVRGTTTRAPTLTVVGADLDGGLENDGDAPGVVLRR